MKPLYQYSHYPTEEALKAELDKLPHKIVLNVNEIAKEVGSPRVANIVLLGATIPFLGIDYQKSGIVFVTSSSAKEKLSSN